MFIGVDLGTSSVKTVLIDRNQKILSTAMMFGLRCGDLISNS